MGLLDDAIREHLELKRRHGADPGEVAELEHEALGPVARRGAPAAAEPQPDLAPADAAPAIASSAPEESSFEETVREADPEVLAESPETHTLAGEEEGSYEETVVEADELWAHEHHGSHSLADSAEGQTIAYDVDELDAVAPPAQAEAPPAEDVVRADDEPAEEDVLEETPEFLQETPEHDRLWFEQKPPRDFDF